MVFENSRGSGFQLGNIKPELVSGGRNHLVIIEGNTVHRWNKITGYWHTHGNKWKYTNSYLQDSIVQLASGDNHSVLVTQKGQLWFLDNEKCSEWIVATTRNQEEQIIQVACGKGHTIVLTKTQDENYNIWGGGSNLFGQTGSTNKRLTHAMEKMLTTKSTITQIACGEYCSFYLTEESKLYACGKHEASGLCHYNGFKYYKTLDHPAAKLIIHQHSIFVQTQNCLYDVVTSKLFYPCPSGVTTKIFSFNHTPTMIFSKNNSIYLWCNKHMMSCQVTNKLSLLEQFDIDQDLSIQHIHMTETCIVVFCVPSTKQVGLQIHRCESKTNFYDVVFKFL
jgi:hypothetical protein